ncbi:MAG: serine hydrolase [Steroidobacteraceae bacterium]
MIRPVKLLSLLCLLPLFAVVTASTPAAARDTHAVKKSAKPAKAGKTSKVAKPAKARATVAPTRKIKAIAEPEPAAQGQSATPGVADPPAVPVRAYILIDATTGRMLTGAAPDDRVEPASITKLMTAYVVFNAISEGRLALTDNVTISERAWKAEGSRTFLQVGIQVPVETLLKGMIVQSGNDAATALAEKVGGSVEGFAGMMNETARRIGMTNSNFTNPTGLPSAELHTTPRDIATLARRLIGEYPQFYKWYSMREFIWDNIRQPNRNGLLARDSTVDGIKTGFTDTAGYCLASSAERNGTRLVAAVFGARSPRKREDASLALLEYGFANYEIAQLRKRGDALLSPRLYKGEADVATLTPERDVKVLVKRGDAKNLRVVTNLRQKIVAPLAAGTRVGDVQVFAGDKLITTVPLVTSTTLMAGGILRRISDTVALWFS